MSSYTVLNPSTYAEISPFTELDDDAEVIRDLFSTIDVDNDGVVSKEELFAAIQRYQDDKELVTALKNLLPGEIESKSVEASISLETFFNAFEQLPRIRGERIRWAKTLGMEGMLARLLKKGNAFDGLCALRELQGEAFESHIKEVSEAFTAIFPTILRCGLLKLQAAAKDSSIKSAVHAHINSKFVLDGAFVGHYATLDDFYRGPEALIGVPNPRILEGAEKEHCLRHPQKIQNLQLRHRDVARPGMGIRGLPQGIQALPPALAASLQPSVSSR